ncbi:MAG TPA: class A beta-lactamase [Allosphingosinicella sp.]|nr:class A beta-lactamase [Allosphingosinicella sp.]
MFVKLGLAAMALLLAASGNDGQLEPRQQRAAPPVGTARQLAAIERASGGRLGVMLVDARGRILFAHRPNERFAMCSTFKLALAAMYADGSDRTPLRIARADLMGNSPYSEQAVGAGEMSVEGAAEHIVTDSDNAAANLLLRRLGGPAAYTRRVRAWGDAVTRLDRFEMALNENARNDPRDTTSPAAMAGTTRRLVMGDLLAAAARDRLRGWMLATRTGPGRIRAGLPAAWTMGHKTGTCGTAYNDVAFLRTPRGNEYVLAVYLDRPTVNARRAEAAIADVARLAAEVVR